MTDRSDGTAGDAIGRGCQIVRVLGVILAGGLSRRMRVDKGFVTLGGNPLIAHAITRLRPQVDGLIVNANGDPDRYAAFALPVIADTLAGHPGPLAGVLAAMRWAEANATGITHVATVPIDTPFFPVTMIDRLTAGIMASPGCLLAFAATASGPQPVFALIHVGLADELERDIASGKARRVVDWLRDQPHAEVLFEEDDDAFFNVNTPEDVVVAERMMRLHN